MRKAFVPALLTVLTILGDCASAQPILLRSATIDTATAQAAAAMPSGRQTRQAYFIVQLDGPVTESRRADISAAGATILDYIPENAFVVRVPPDRVEQVRRARGVRYLGYLQPDFRADQAVRRQKAARSDILVQLFPGEATDTLRAYARTRGGRIIDASSTERFVRIDLPRAAIDGLLRLEGVAWVEEWRQPRIMNNVAQQITGVESTRERTGFYGEGQILAVADTGLDSGSTSTMSADFVDRIVKTYGLKRPGEWSDLAGHGTHVTGTAVGSGSLSGSNPPAHDYSGSFAGVAPEASIVFQSIGDSSPNAVYPPLDLSELFQPTYTDGARVHSNSWGIPAQGNYTVYAQQVDDFLWSHKDFVAVFAAGNEGEDRSPMDGVTDTYSLYTPATAKNCITVGATESARSTGLITTYGQSWPSDFSRTPISSDYISDNASGMVAWSSRGPCADNRIKPDICAPGSNIVSSRSHAAMNTGWLLYDPHYVYWGGTSMSTPMVAGAALLVREYYVKTHSIQPSAALVKASLMNSALEIYPGQYGSGTTRDIRNTRPDNSEGWGRLDLSRCIEPAAPTVVDFIDETSGLATTESRQYQFVVLNNSVPLSITLVWTDPPGTPLAAKELVNNLNLHVLAPNGFTQYRGNGGSVFDDLNNVETVDIASPSAGVYTVTVSAPNVPQGPQPFALVVSGALPGGYVAGHAKTGSGRPIAGATITATPQGGGATRSTVTDGNGAYTVHLSPGDYDIAAVKSGWSFNPSQLSIEIQEVGVESTDFTGSAPLGSASGTITTTLGGVTNYILESPHPYYDDCDLVYTITAQEGASRIRVHFSDIDLQDYFDFVYVENEDGSESQSFTSVDSDFWSEWVTGNVARIRLVADNMENYWGFYIDGYETDLQTVGGHSGVTVAASPYTESTVSGEGGAYTISSLEPVAYNLTPQKELWQFSPAVALINVPPGGSVPGVDFLSFAPGSIRGRVLTGDVHSFPYTAQSSHPYDDEAYQVWELTYNGAEPCSRIRVHFSRLETEQDYDFVFIENPDGEVVDVFTGIYPGDVWSSWIAGNQLRIVLKSDPYYGGPYNQYWGFAASEYQIAGNERPLAGATASLQPSGATAASQSDGFFDFLEAGAGTQYTVTVSKPFWELSPGPAAVNCVSGLLSAVPDYFAILGLVPSIGDAKSFADGEQVLLAGLVVTAAGGRFVDAFYAEEENRSSGIRVQKTAHGLAVGQKVNIAGVIHTDADGERYIEATNVTPSGSGSIEPLGMPNSRLGGGDWKYNPSTGAGQAGITGHSGLNNIGLLTRIWGMVSLAGSDFFYVDDGSGVEDGSGTRGIYVDTGDLEAPDAGDFVIVAGISRCEHYLGALVNTLTPRSQSDIIIAVAGTGGVSSDDPRE